LPVCEPETTEDESPRVLNQPMAKDCQNEIVAVRRQSEHDKALKTQTALSTDISQNLIYKLLVDVAWSPPAVKISLQRTHSCAGQNIVCRHVQSHICRCHEPLAGILQTEMHHKSEKRRQRSRSLTK
jgi:hypothetical protein